MSSQSTAISNFKFAASIKFGPGAVKELAPVIKEAAPQASIFVVADKGVIQAGLVRRVTDLLDAAGLKYTTFSDVQPNPTDANVDEGAAAYRAAGCGIIIAIGGGSCIDAAKGIQVMAAHPGKLAQYLAGPGSLRITAPLPRLIALPTTSGTGSEVTGAAVITDTTQHRKRFVSPGSPYLAVVDPELTLGMPPRLTADSGLDALTHCIESYVANRFSPFGAAVALEGMKLAAGNLAAAYHDGKNLKARENMSLAAVMGGAAFGPLGSGLGAAHSLAHQLSTEAGVSHGMANAIMLPHVMRFCLEAAAARYADIGRALGENTWDMSPRRAAEKAVDAVVRLCEEMDVPARLRDLGVRRESIPAMAKNALADGLHRNGPRSCTEGDLKALYEAAW